MSTDTTLEVSDEARCTAHGSRRTQLFQVVKLFGASTISNLGDGIGIIAYPWLASAVTRHPLLIALVGVV